MSRGSDRSLVSSRGGTKHGAEKSGGSNTKCIVTVGIILPLLAAIIGVAAWSVSSDSVHRRSPSTTVYHIGRSSHLNGDHLFEERNDNDDLVFGQKVPIGGAVSKDVLGPDVEEERDILPPVEDNPAERDPLYVVHYVPRGAQKEATSEAPVPSPAPDILSKLMQNGKVPGGGKGTPQFVVFAPMPDEEEDADDRSMEVPRKRTKKRKKVRQEYDYEEEYPANTRVRPQKAPVPRNGFYDSSNDGQGYTQNAPPCCNHQGGGGGMMPQQPMMTTQAPSGGLTISLGQGLPMSPLGILRQILRPKVDLKKKLFFGVQLENGIGFGGNQGGQMQGGQMTQGNMGQMQGGHMGGGQMGGQQGGGGGMTYTFG